MSPVKHAGRDLRLDARLSKRQRGVTLIVVLLILVVVTIVGLGAAQIALLGERSTRYDRDYLIASQAAEAALVDAEIDIAGPNAAAAQRVATFDPYNIGVYAVGCSTVPATRGLCRAADENVKPVWATVDFMATGNAAPTVEFGEFTGRPFKSGSTGIQPDRRPRYVIEQVADLEQGGNASESATPPPKMYRITAIGFGPRPDIQVVMQTAFRKPSPQP